MPSDGSLPHSNQCGNSGAAGAAESDPNFAAPPLPPGGGGWVRQCGTTGLSQVRQSPSAASECVERRSPDDIIAVLADRFPAAFTIDPTARRPLAVGIHLKIAAAAPDLSRVDVRRALSRYTHKSSYRRTLFAGAVRVDLQGASAGEVTAEQAEFAAAERKERHHPKTPSQPVVESGPTVTTPEPSQNLARVLPAALPVEGNARPRAISRSEHRKPGNTEQVTVDG